MVYPSLLKVIAGKFTVSLSPGFNAPMDKGAGTGLPSGTAICNTEGGEATCPLLVTVAVPVNDCPAKIMGVN